MPPDSPPTIQEFRVRAVRVPKTEPHRTASGVVTGSPLVLTDVVTDTGVSGHSVVFTCTPAALTPTAEFIRNCEALVRARRSPLRRELRSSAGRTGGGHWTCGTPSRRGPRTWSCRT